MKVKKVKKELKSMVEFKEFLKNPSPKVKVPLYTEIEVNQRTTNSGDGTVKKTLSQRMDKLEVTVKELVTTVNDLAKEMRDGFKRVNTRLDNVEKRLDYNGLKIEAIEKRLDYNNLKRLPN